MTDRDRLIELLQSASDKYINLLHFEKEILADYLLENGVIVPPCKVGDYVLWNNGLKDSKTIMIEVEGFHYDTTDLGLRYILKKVGQPIINHSGIVGIVPKEEAEKKIKECEGK